MPDSMLGFLVNIYRPPSSSKYSQPISVFLDEFQTFLSSAATTPHEFIITGDFNIHLDDHLDSSAQQFTDLLSSTYLAQHVSSLLTYIIIHWTSLSLLLTQISLHHYHNLLSLYLITFLFHSPQPYDHTFSHPSEFTFRRTKKH